MKKTDILVIETLQEVDLAVVGEIFFLVFNSVGEKWSRETASTHVKENFFGDAHFVAKVDQKVVGFIMAIPLTRENGLEFFVDSICVLPEYQSRGIGKQLWEHFLAFAKEQAVVGIRLLGNHHLDSFRWYMKLGFKESGWVELHFSM